MDLSKLMGNMYKLLIATAEYNTSGLHPEKYMMSDEQKQALLMLEEDSYIVLSLREQIDYYTQIVQSELRKSANELTNRAETLVKKMIA